VALLAGSVLIVMMVELLNTAVEAAIDRIGPGTARTLQARQGHGQRAVFLSLLLAGGIWLTALVRFFSA
jgi:diacylglycerol kinase (ATP)